MSIIKSASLILINGFVEGIQKQNFKLLLLKRIVTSKSFAGKIVFPGGSLDKCDYSDRWNGIIERGFSTDQLKSLVCENEMSLYMNSKSLSIIIPQIFYRICAIRETFEETGVLLAFDKHHRTVISDEAITADIKLQNWQKKVSENGEVFIDMLMDYELTPDLSSLYEWSEWLTPSIIPSRFHTAFFVAFINNRLKTNVNLDESKSLHCLTAAEAYEQFLLSENLAPPQMLELFDLSSLCSIERVIAEAKKRQKIGGLHNISQILRLSDGSISVLQGDSRFEKGADEIREYTNLSVDQLSGDRFQRRFVWTKGKPLYHVNITV